MVERTRQKGERRIEIKRFTASGSTVSIEKVEANKNFTGAKLDCVVCEDPVRGQHLEYRLLESNPHTGELYVAEVFSACTDHSDEFEGTMSEIMDDLEDFDPSELNGAYLLEDVIKDAILARLEDEFGPINSSNDN
jgi:hypothetical protein